MNQQYLAILFAFAVCLTLFGCGKGTDKETAIITSESITQTQETAASKSESEENQNIGLPNPMEYYGSLEAINKVSGGNLQSPAVMGVIDESYCIIRGNPLIAQYNFQLNCLSYTFRYSSDTAMDISGLYTNTGTIFQDSVQTEYTSACFDSYKAARTILADGQYVLILDDPDEVFTISDFDSIAQELFSMAAQRTDPISAYAGNWHEKIAGRAYMEVTADEDLLSFKVWWPNSANEKYYWEFSGKINEDGNIYYENAVVTIITWDEKNNEHLQVWKENASGSVSITADGAMLWIENDTDNPEGSIFERNY